MATTQVTHTPTPWEYHENWDHTVEIWQSDENSKRITEELTVEDAAFIVRAVNSHEELIEIVKTVQRLAFQKGSTELMQRCKQTIAKADAK